MPRLDNVATQIQPGDVLLFEGRGFWSSVIRLRTASKITHAGFAFEVHGRLACLEAAEGSGVRIHPLDTYLAAGHRIHWHRLLAREYGVSRERVMDFALGEWGKRYASATQFLRSFGFAAARLANRCGCKIDTNADRWFCSELVQQGILSGGWKPEAEIHPAQTPPGDLAFLPCLKPEGLLS